MIFTEIPDSVVILRSKGVFRQVAAFIRENAIYAKHGSGFIRLYTQGATSVPTIRYEFIDTPKVQRHAGAHGRLFVKGDK